MDKAQYRGILVFVEQHEGIIQNIAFELIGEAHNLADQISKQVTVILCGYQVKGLSDQFTHMGADRVLVADNSNLKDYLIEQYAQAVYHITTVYKPGIVLFGATTIGRDLAPRLSMRLCTGLTADCTSLEIGKDRDLMIT